MPNIFIERQNSRVARWFIFIPKIPILGIFWKALE
jgi:hypothetical protein